MPNTLRFEPETRQFATTPIPRLETSSPGHGALARRCLRTYSPRVTPDTCRALAKYNRWMNEKLYATSALLSDEERKRDRGAFFKSIHGTLNHLLLADRVWMGRFTGASLPGDWLGPGGIRSLDQELYADFEELRRERAKTDDEIDAYVASLDEEKIAGVLRYERRGKIHEHPLWWAVLHLFNHETHHRGQVTTLLMQAGHDPGSTDFIAMIRS